MREVLGADQHQALQERIRAGARHAGRHLAIDQQTLGQIGDGTVTGQTRPQLVVLGGLTLPVGRIATDGLDARLAHHHRAVHERVVEQQLELQRGVIAGMIVHPAGRGIAGPDLGPGAEQPASGVCLQIGDLTGEALGMAEVILILPGNQRPPRQRDAAVQRCREAGIFLVVQADARILEPFEHRGRIVAGTVVDEDQLEIAEGLRQHAVDGPPDICGAVVDRQHHTDQWSRHRCIQAAGSRSRVS